MKQLTKQITCAAAMALMIAVQPAFADEDYQKDVAGGMMLFDLVFVRTIGLLGVVAGSAAFVVSLPFTIPSGSVDKAKEELINAPVRYTFKRPLGEIQKSE